MIKKIIGHLVLIACLSSLALAADPFYTGLLNEGKTLYLGGKYDQALENFKIAEFGLADEREFVPELYFYYALAQYKKGAISESRALLERLKTAAASADIDKLPKPKEIERDLSIMVRALKYSSQPGAKPGDIAFFNLFYETWDQIREKNLVAAEANIERLNKLNGDKARLAFLAGYLAFQKGEHKKCVNRLEKVAAALGDELGEDAQFYLAFCQLKRGDLASAEKYAQKIKNPDYVHRLMVLMDEVKVAQGMKNKKK